MPDTPLIDFGLRWFKDIIGKITSWFTTELTSGYRSLAADFFATPVPESGGNSLVFGVPAASDEPWHSIYQATVKGEMLVFALLTLLICVQGRHFLRIFNVSSAYETRRTSRSAWLGAVAIVAWYWIGVLALYMVEALTIALMPNLTTVGAAMVDLLPEAASNPFLTMALAMTGGLAMVALKALFFLRKVLLFVYMYAMPIGLAVTFGNVPILSGIGKRLSLQFVPLAVLPLPTALLFRGIGLLLGSNALAPGTELLEYLVVAAVPVVALWVTWKTFGYASPLTARVLGGAGRTAVTVGTAAAAGYVAGPRAAATAARWGPRAGAGQAASQYAFGDDGGGGRGGPPGGGSGGTTNDNVATADDGGVPRYRRSENDPSYY